MFSPLDRLLPLFESGSRWVARGFYNSARTAIRSRLCGPNTFPPLPIFTFCREDTLFYCARALFFSAHAWRLRNSFKTQSAHACAIQTRFRPSHLGVFFQPFSLKCNGLLRFGFAKMTFSLLRPSPCFKRPRLASPNFPKNAIRLRLCGPNTVPSIHF